jgi:hypothetical protein
MKEDKANWDGDILTVEQSFEWPEPHTKISAFKRCDLADGKAVYFVAVDGQVFGLVPLTNETALCTVDAALRAVALCTINGVLSAAGAKCFYATFALQNRTPAALKRWADKWSKRTIKADWMDASVRVA